MHWTNIMIIIMKRVSLIVFLKDDIFNHQINNSRRLHTSHATLPHVDPGRDIVEKYRHLVDLWEIRRKCWPFECHVASVKKTSCMRLGIIMLKHVHIFRRLKCGGTWYMFQHIVTVILDIIMPLHMYSTVMQWKLMPLNHNEKIKFTVNNNVFLLRLGIIYINQLACLDTNHYFGMLA